MFRETGTTDLGQKNITFIAEIIKRQNAKIYFDTSVFGGAFDKEFEETTLQLFERVKMGQVICVFSDLTETELLNAPEKVKQHFKNLPKENIERVLVTDKILILASKYVAEKVVGQTPS